MNRPQIDVIIPAFNEENSIDKVLADIPMDLVREVIVCNNASTDKTAEVASKAGATLVEQPIKGYGNACLKGMEYVANKSPEDQPDIVIFIDACLLYTSPSPRDRTRSRMPSSA